MRSATSDVTSCTTRYDVRPDHPRAPLQGPCRAAQHAAACGLPRRRARRPLSRRRFAQARASCRRAARPVAPRRRRSEGGPAAHRRQGGTSRFAAARAPRSARRHRRRSSSSGGLRAALRLHRRGRERRGSPGGRPGRCAPRFGARAHPGRRALRHPKTGFQRAHRRRAAHLLVRRACGRGARARGSASGRASGRAS